VIGGNDKYCLVKDAGSLILRTEDLPQLTIKVDH